jgi:hypothetical protein
MNRYSCFKHTCSIMFLDASERTIIHLHEEQTPFRLLVPKVT